MLALALSLAIVAPMPAVEPKVATPRVTITQSHERMSQPTNAVSHTTQAEAIHAALVEGNDAPELLMPTSWWAEQLAQVEQSTEGTETP
jgi:hypothetical protein